MKHLTESELARLKHQLHTLKAQCTDDLRSQVNDATLQRTAIANEGAHDRSDDAQADASSLLEGSMEDHYVTELADVEAALARMTTGDFGVCTNCGEPVPLPRLVAYPTAKRCVKCQEALEQKRGKKP